MILPGTTPTQLNRNTLANGNLTNNNPVNWYTFTAGSSTHYIHVSFSGTLPPGNGVYVYLYNSADTTVGYSRLYGSTLYYSPSTLTDGDEYYVRVTPYTASDTGTYQIGYNGNEIPPGMSPTPLYTSWVNGSLSSTNPVNWYTFTASGTFDGSTQIPHFIYVGNFSTPDFARFGVSVKMYTQYGQVHQDGIGLQGVIDLKSGMSVTPRVFSGMTYYLRVTPYDPAYTGTYQIWSSPSGIPPGITTTPLGTGSWTGGSLGGSNYAKWYTFTATAASQYIHVRNLLGDITSSGVYVEVYTSSGARVDSKTRLYGSTLYLSRTLTIGQAYYIKVTPYSYVYDTGTFQIAFNASYTPPN
jgi:hypothetical protein